MRANASVCNHLDALCAAMEAQLGAVDELRTATLRLGRVVEEDAEADALGSALKEHRAALDRAQTAEEDARRLRFALMELLALERWQLRDLKEAVGSQTPAPERTRAESLVARVSSLSAEIVAVLKVLDASGPRVEGQLRRRLDEVGSEARHLRQGRRLANAYGAPTGQAFARFIDQRE